MERFTTTNTDEIKNSEDERMEETSNTVTVKWKRKKSFKQGPFEADGLERYPIQKVKVIHKGLLRRMVYNVVDCQQTQRNKEYAEQHKKVYLIVTSL